jgi:hypothetical protein
MALETKSPPRPIYRIGRKPDPWLGPDWSRVSSDGTFGNRFDDPESYYRVLYASSQQVSCYIETLARFRPDLSLLAELREISGEDDFFPAGQVPLDWTTNRLIGTASVDGNYASIYASEWITFLRRKLATECLRLGIRDLDTSVLQAGAPRQITQLASRVVYELGLPGICYPSRYGHDLENWALFEPFHIQHSVSNPIANEDPALIEALRILGLKIH